MISSLTLWAWSVKDYRFSELNPYSPPLISIGFTFWIGYVVALLTTFLASAPILRYLATLISSFYTINTLSVIFPYCIHHDSIGNLYLSAIGKGGYAGGSIAGFYAFNGLLINLCNLKVLMMARIYPTFSWALYILSLYFLYESLAPYLPREASLEAFLFYVLVLSPTFWFRLNAAPQTIGMVLSIFALALFVKALSAHNLALWSLFSITYLALMLTHPLTPLFLVPALVAVQVLVHESINVLNFIKYSLKYVFPLFLPYLALLIYKAEYFYPYFYHLKPPLKFPSTLGISCYKMPYVTWMAPGAPSKYLFLNLLYIAYLALTLFLSLIVAWRRSPNFGLTSLIWLGALLAVLLIFLTPFFSKFLSRPLLFLSLPLGLIFSVALGPIFGVNRLNFIKILLIVSLVSISVLGLYRAYYYYGAFDIPTPTQVEAHKWLMTHVKNKVVSVDAFLHTVDYALNEGNVIKLAGRIANIGRLLSAHYSMITQQMRTYTSFEAGKFYPLTKLGALERSELAFRGKVYENDHVRIYRTWRP